MKAMSRLARAALLLAALLLPPGSPPPVLAAEAVVALPDFSVRVPEDWITRVAPTPAEEGMTCAVFQRPADNSAIFVMTGANRGSLDAFAEDFRRFHQAEPLPCDEPDARRLGFTRDGVPCEAWIAVQDGVFLCMILYGDIDGCLNFVAHSIDDGGRPGLFPRAARDPDPVPGRTDADAGTPGDGAGREDIR